MAVMTSDESTPIGLCQGNMTDAKAGLSTARTKINAAIDNMTTLMGVEATAANTKAYNEAFLMRAKLRVCLGQINGSLGSIEAAHAEASLAGDLLWSNFGATYIFAPGR